MHKMQYKILAIDVALSQQNQMKNTKASTKPKEELPGQVTGFSEDKCIENESITVTISMKDEYINIGTASLV